MRVRYVTRQTFVVALAVGLAAALAPIGVEAAKRTARAIAVDKKGQAKVVVTNRPAVRVSGGVTVANEPSVRVPGGVAVTNEPSVKVPGGVTVNNQPTEMAVTAAPGELTATTRPPLDDVFNFYAADVQNLTTRPVLELPAGRSAAIAHVTVAVHNFGNPVAEPNVAEVIRYVRESGSNTCGGSGWTGTVLRRLVVPTDETLEVDLSSAPLVIKPDPGGDPVCVGMKLWQWVSETKVVFMADGYLF